LGPTLAELRGVLTPGGRLIVAVDHPFAIQAVDGMARRTTSYFATYRCTGEWTTGGQTAPMSFHRPLHAMTDAFTAVGFSDLRHQRTTSRAGSSRTVP
jgi:hypothetical protein